MNGIKLKIWDLKLVSESYVRWVLLILLVAFLSPDLSIAEETKKSRSLDSAKNLDPVDLKHVFLCALSLRRMRQVMKSQ